MRKVLIAIAALGLVGWATADARAQWSVRFDQQTFSTIAPQGFSLTNVPMLARPYETLPKETIPLDGVHRRPVELVSMQPSAVPQYSIPRDDYDIGIAPGHENYNIGNSVFGYLKQPVRRPTRGQTAQAFAQQTATTSRRQPLGW